MRKFELATGIMIYDDVVPNHQSLVNDIEEVVASKVISWQPAAVQTYDQPSVDTSSRDTSTIAIPYSSSSEVNYSNPQTTFYGELSSIFYSSFEPVERDYMNSFGIDFKNHYSWDILKYGVGQKFTNHIDDHTDYPRRVSTVYYMNDNYEGGLIHFPRFNVSFKPRANQMILFPSNYIYNHSVVPVTEGTRYAVVSWIN
jgi:hypothetical protein